MLKNIKGFLRERIFLLKLITSFLLLAGMFLILIQVFFRQMNRIAREDAVEVCGEKFIRNSSEISQILEDIYTGGIILVRDDIVTSSVKNYSDLTAEDRVKLPGVFRMLSELTFRENTVASAYLFVDDEKVYSSTGLYDRELFFEQYHQYESFDAGDILASGSTSEAMMFLKPTGLSSGGRVTQVLPMVITRQWNHIVLVQDIDIQSLGEVLSNFSDSYEAYYIVLDGEILYQSQEGDASYLLEEEYGENGRDILLRQDILYGFSLYCRIDTEILEEQLTAKYQRFSYAFVGFMAAIGIFVILLCFRLYNPIRQLRQIIMEESRNQDRVGEFKDMTREIISLRNHFHSTEGNLKRILSSYDKAQLSMTVFYNKYPASQEEQARLLDSLRPKGGEVCCAAVELIMEQTEGNPMRSFDERQKYLLEETISILLEDVLCRKVNAYVVPRNYLSYVVIMGSSGLSDALIEEAFQEAAKIFRYDFSYCKIRVGVGSRADHIRELQKSYFIAETAAYLYGTDLKFQILYGEDLPFVSHFGLEREELQSLENAIRAGNDKSLSAKLREWNRILYEKKVLIQEQKHFWYEIFRRVYKIANAEKLDFYELAGMEADYFIYGVSGITDRIDGYMDHVWNAAMALCRYFQSQSANVKERIDEVIQYIHRNYAASIGLTEIADEFGISSHYLSRIFKAGTGVNLSDYIAGYRIERAQELLKNTAKSIQEIGEAVGIPSRATFQRLFKQITGVSPSEYRKMR